MLKPLVFFGGFCASMASRVKPALESLLQAKAPQRFEGGLNIA
jgi:hypothetical protein